jgi:hypothetical protein
LNRKTHPHYYSTWQDAHASPPPQERDTAAGGRTRNEPMFCFETAAKLFFWSCLTYEDFGDVSGPSVSGLRVEVLEGC